MYKDQSRIAAIELNSHSCWEVQFKPNAILTMEDIVSIYRYIDSTDMTHPVLFDWRAIQGIEFEALEYVARVQDQDHPMAVVAEPGSIGEKYGHLIDQLCEDSCTCLVFSTLHEARIWLSQAFQKEA